MGTLIFQGTLLPFVFNYFMHKTLCTKQVPRKNFVVNNLVGGEIHVVFFIWGIAPMPPVAKWLVELLTMILTLI